MSMAGNTKTVFDLSFLIDNNIFTCSHIVGHEDLDATATGKAVIGLIDCLNNPAYLRDHVRYVNNLLSMRNPFTIDLVKDTIYQVLYDHQHLFQKKMKGENAVLDCDEPNSKPIQST